MPKCYQLVGVPGAGKSTWINSQDWSKDCHYASTDMWVDLEAERVGKTYSEIFKDYMPMAVKLMANHVTMAREKNMDIIWDQTSTSVASRKKKFNMLPDYEHIAVVFKTPEPEELTRRLASRPGKVIPHFVIQQMISSFEMPSLDEGFTQVWFAS